MHSNWADRLPPKPRRRALALLAATPLFLGLAAFSPLAPPAQAQSAPAPTVGPFKASASGNLMDLQAVSVAGLTLADAVVAPSTAEVDTSADPRSSAEATNLDATLLDTLDLPNLLTRSTQTAPPDNADPATDDFLSLDVGALLDVSAGDTMAHARWPGDNECVAADVPLAESKSSLAGLQLFDLGLAGSVADLGNGAAYTSTALSLPSVPGEGDPRAVQAQSTTNLATLGVLGSLGLTAEVVGPAVLTATATGLAGGADVTYDAPIVRASGTLLGPDPVELTPANPEVSVEVTLLDLIKIADVTLSLGDLTNVVESADGTTASGEASILHLNVTLLGDLVPVTVLDTVVGSQSVSATAPAGGINCEPPTDPENPIEVTKSASAQTVPPGGSFDYTITASNTSATCTLTDVKVVDVITGPAGSSVTGTEPTATTVDGMTVTWDDAGDIAPGGNAKFVVRVKVPLDATAGASYSDTATVTGTCDDTDFTDDFTLDGVPKISSVVARVGALPRTGGPNDLLLLAIPGVLLSVAVGFRRLRRAAGGSSELA